MTDTIKIDSTRMSRAERTCVVAYLRTLSLEDAAAETGMKRDTLRRYLGRAGVGLTERKALLAGVPYLLVGHTCSAPNFTAPTDAATAVFETVPVVPPERLDVVAQHRFEQEIKALKTEAKLLTARLAASDEYRSSILGISIKPAYVEDSFLRADKSQGGQAIILHVSDLHVGETIEREEVSGVNEYNFDIARKRTGRLFEKASILSTTAWPASDDAPSAVYVLLGGDLISGAGLHPEHAETDGGTAIEQVKYAATWISSGILRLNLDLLAHFGVSIPIHVISVVGNHGRMTPGKPRTKLVTLQSYDTLVADFVEAALRSYENIKHYQPRGFDAYFSAVGWPCLVTHGDRMGSGGGTGFIGPMASIIKGHRKIVDTEYRQRRPVRYVFSGHFHTTGMSPFGFASGAGCGYGEFAKSIRADPEPAQQNYVVLHERLGMIRYQPIVLGTPDEGTMYSPNGGLLLPSL
jgi:hypothetical protein